MRLPVSHDDVPICTYLPSSRNTLTTKLRNYGRFDKLFILMPFGRFSLGRGFGCSYVVM